MTRNKLITHFEPKPIQLVFASFAVLACLLLVGIKSPFLIFAFFLLLFYPVRRVPINQADKKEGFTVVILSALFSLFTTLRYIENLFCGNNLLNFISIVFSLFGTFALYCPAVHTLIYRFSHRGEVKNTIAHFSMRKSFWLSFGFIFICWFLTLLTKYPGIITADSIWQLNQAVGNMPLSNHHPVASTLLIKLVYGTALSITGNPNFSAACYSTFQMTVMAFIASYSISVLLSKCRSRLFFVLAVAFYALFPTNSYYSISMWKDVFFAGAVLLFSTVIYQLIDARNNKHLCAKKSVPLLVAFFISAAGMCLLRTNGIIAFVLTIPVLIYVFSKKLRSVIIVAACALTVSVIILGPVYSSLGVIQVDTIEALSIPAQHIARVVADGKQLTDEQYILLGKIIDVNKIPEKYESWISNPIKDLVRETNNQEYLNGHIFDYLKLWLQIGLKYPGEYVLAQIDQTSGYIFPQKYWIVSDDILQNDLGIYSSVLLPESVANVILSFRLFLLNQYMSLFFGCGATAWIFFILIAVCMLRKKRSHLLVYLPVLLNYLTMFIATPVFSEFRYIYSMFICLPLFAVIPFIPEAAKKSIAEAEEPATANV